MFGFQAAGAAPLVTGRAGAREPATIATAIRIGNPASWTEAPRRAVASRAAGIAAVTDREILAAYRLLAREEGVFVEMASAASVAGCWLDAGVERRPPGRLHGHRQRPQGPRLGPGRRPAPDPGRRRPRRPPPPPSR